jgi:urea transport system permease protein
VPRRPLLTRSGWAVFLFAAYVLLVLVPGLNLLLPANHPFHLSDYWVTLAARSCATRSSRWRWT